MSKCRQAQHFIAMVSRSTAIKWGMGAQHVIAMLQQSTAIKWGMGYIKKSENQKNYPFGIIHKETTQL